MANQQQYQSVRYAPYLLDTEEKRDVPIQIHQLLFAAPIPVERRSSALQMVTSVMSAIATRTATSPLERLKLLRQVANPNYLGVSLRVALVNVYKLSGWTGYFRGNACNIIRVIPFSAIEFHHMFCFKNLIKSPDDPRHKASLLYSGTITALIGSIATYPLDFVRTVLTVQTAHKYKNFRDVAKRVYRKKGLIAFYRGMLITLLVLPRQGVVPYLTIKMTAFDWLKAKYFPEHPSTRSKYVPVIYGAVAATLATYMTYPVDLLRRRMQLIVSVYTVSGSGSVL